MENNQQTIVIGLGGSGKKVITHLKRNIEENAKHGLDDYKYLKFLCIDTDTNTPKLTSQVVDSSKLEIKGDEMIGLHATGGVDAEKVKNDWPEGYWFIPEEFNGRLKGDFSKGAGQRKFLGRFIFAYKANDVYRKLQNVMTTMIPMGSGDGVEKNSINVFICASICGGTGSGTFLDTAYMVRKIAESMGNVQVNIFGLLATASVFNGVGGDVSMGVNSYASLIELDNFMNKVNHTNSNRAFVDAYPYFSKGNMDNLKAFKQAPFDYPFIFEGRNQSGVSLASVDEYAEIASRFIYFMAGSAVGSSCVSQMDNVKTSDNDSTKNKPLNYWGLGTHSVVYPVRKIKQLCGKMMASKYLKTVLESDETDLDIERTVEKFIAKEFNGLKYEISTRVEDAIEEEITNKSNPSTAKMYSWKEIVGTLNNVKVSLKDDMRKAKKIDYEDLLNKKKVFVEHLNEKLNELSNIREVADESDKDKKITGSITKACKFLECLYKKLDIRSVDLNKKIEDYKHAQEDLDKEGTSFKAQLDEAAKKLSFMGGQGSANNYFNTFVSGYEEMADDSANQFRYMLLKSIKNENGNEKDPGLLSAINTKISVYQQLAQVFIKFVGDFDKELEQNKSYTGSTLSTTTIYNYDKDVVANYEMLLNKNASVLVNIQTDLLSPFEKTGFGEESTDSIYEKIGKSSEVFRQNLIKSCTVLFDDVLNKTVTERIEEDGMVSDKWGNDYFTGLASDIWLNLTGSLTNELGLGNREFDAITLPASVYDNKPCSKICGSNINDQICPVDDEAKAVDCPLHGKCIKQCLLESRKKVGGNQKISILHTDDDSEINVLHTITGFPLYVVSEFISNYRPDYLQRLKNEGGVTGADKIHMFGKQVFDDLDEKTLELDDSKLQLRKDLILLQIVKPAEDRGAFIQVKTDPYKIVLYKMKSGKIEEVEMGKNFLDLENNYEKVTLNWKEKFFGIESLAKKYMDYFRENESIKKQFLNKLKEWFENFKEQEAPEGFKIDGILSSELCEKYRIAANELSKELHGEVLIKEEDVSKQSADEFKVIM